MTVLARRAVSAARPPTRPAAAAAACRQRYRRRRQTTPTDDEDRQTTNASVQNKTDPLGGPVIIAGMCDLTCIPHFDFIELSEDSQLGLGITNTHILNTTLITA